MKYRVWDKELNTYECTNHILLKQNGDIYNEEYDEVMDERYVIEMFTGLKDVNEKEVFEGDIVKRTSGLIGDKYDDFIGIVKFDLAAFYIESFGGNDGTYLWDDVQYLVILGNIYANPDLIK